MDILGYLKNTHKNPKFGKVRQVPTREFPTKFPDWDLSHSFKFGIFVGLNTLKYPKMGIRYYYIITTRNPLLLHQNRAQGSFFPLQSYSKKTLRKNVPKTARKYKRSVLMTPGHPVNRTAKNMLVLINVLRIQRSLFLDYLPHKIQFTKEEITLKTLVLSPEANTLPQCKSSWQQITN